MRRACFVIKDDLVVTIELDFMECYYIEEANSLRIRQMARIEHGVL